MKKLLLRAMLATALLCPFTQLAPQSQEEILNRIKSEKINFIQLNFTDIFGNPKSYTVTANMAESVLKRGTNFDGSSVAGLTNINESDLLLKPDLNSFTIFPYLYNKTAHFICDVYSENGHPFESYPRNILKKVSAEAQEMGYQFNVSPELEFFLVKQDSPEATDSMGYCESAQLDKHHKIKLVILNVLNALEMQPEKTHHEVAPGQHEITFKYGEAVWTADRILMAKTIIKQIAQENGLKATFMPKPFFGKTGSGMHINYSLYDIENNKNAFYDPSGEHHLSEIAKSFIAGNLDNISGMTALLNATVNSYKRLVKGYEAPVYIGWAAKNRSALIRIPQAEVGESIRAELRSPDATCDPYLALAIILKSGLVGVKAKKALTLEFKENLFKLTPKEIEARNIKALPHSLEEALIEMEKNTLVKETLGENLFFTYIKLKKQEVQEYNIFVTDWEVEKYL